MERCGIKTIENAGIADMINSGSYKVDKVTFSVLGGTYLQD